MYIYSLLLVLRIDQSDTTTKFTKMMNTTLLPLQSLEVVDQLEE
jgi:hypothetical protein